MRYFQRQALEPIIQAELDVKTSKNWGKLTEDQREEIVEKLMASQKSLCGYCECRISEKENAYHVEHFIERHDDDTKIFEYNNMLLSCQGNTIPVIKPTTPEDVLEKKRNISCGHGKEKYRHKRVEIDYSMLLNPTNENVSALFSYENGIVEPSKKCTPIEEEQVKYTIQRLNLDAKTVEDNRKTELDIINELFKDLTEEQKRIQLDGLLDETQAVLNPYFSTIKDNFGFMLLA